MSASPSMACVARNAALVQIQLSRQLSQGRRRKVSTTWPHSPAIARRQRCLCDRWQNNRDFNWFTKQKEKAEVKVDLDEIAEIKRKEAEAMAEALGGHAKRHHDAHNVDQEEMKRMIKADLEASELTSSGLGYGRLGFQMPVSAPPAASASESRKRPAEDSNSPRQDDKATEPKQVDRDAKRRDRDAMHSDRDSKYRDRDSKHSDRDSKYRDRDSKYSDRDSKYRDRDSKYRDRDSEARHDKKRKSRWDDRKDSRDERRER